MQHFPFRLLALIPKVVVRVRGFGFRMLVRLAGGRCAKGMRIERGFRLRQGFHSGLSFGPDVYFGRDTTIDCLPDATLRVGSNTTFTQGCFISVCARLEIGNDVLIGEYTSIRDANHDISRRDIAVVDQPMVPKPVTIADDVWIGRGCAILAGAKIGRGAVVGANSVVTRNVDAHAVVAGAPASLIKSRREG